MSVDSDAERQQLLASLDLEYPLYSDLGLEITDAYGVREAGKAHPRPATLVLDDEHRVVFAHLGDSPGDRPALADVIAAVPE